MTIGPLAGVRVLDLADQSAVFATRILADLGADVIRVEPPDGGSLRALAPFYGEAGSETSFVHLYNNANKRSITLDLERAEGRDLFRRLASTADVVFETYPPGELDKLGIGFDSLHIVHPRLIMVSVTPFGQTGPWKHWRANDLVAGAAGGLVFISGEMQDPPVQGGGNPAFAMASLAASTGAMIALTGRDRDGGEGMHVDISVQEATVMSVLQTANANHWTRSGILPARPGLSIAVRCKDDKWVGLNPRADRFGALLSWAEATGVHTELGEEDWQLALGGGLDRLGPVVELINEIAAQYTRDEVEAYAEELDLLCLPILRLSEMQDVAHYQVNEQFVEVGSRQENTQMIFPRSPVDAMQREVAIRAAPRLGEHNREIYGEIGIDAQEIAKLQEMKVI